jgi:hypothetical protein
MWTIGLKARGGIRIRHVVYAKAVAGARASVGRTGKISALFSCQRMRFLPGSFRSTAFHNKIDTLGFRRPDAEVGLVWPDEFRANGVTTFERSCRVVRPYSHLFTVLVLLLKSFEATPERGLKTQETNACTTPGLINWLKTFQNPVNERDRTQH